MAGMQCTHVTPASANCSRRGNSVTLGLGLHRLYLHKENNANISKISHLSLRMNLRTYQRDTLSKNKRSHYLSKLTTVPERKL